MTRKNRFRYEMLVRVRDYGMLHKEAFPEASAQAFARVTAAVAAVDEHMKAQMLATAEAGRVKAATRAAVFDDMKTIALAARRVTRPEPNGNPFKVPARRSLKGEISAARVFLDEAETRRDEFVRFGLPPTFISDFRVLVDDLQRAVDVRTSSKTARRLAAAGINTALKQGFEAVRDLDVAVKVATRSDPTRFAAWQTARYIEGQSSQRAPAPATPKDPATPMPPPVPEPAGAEPATPPAATPAGPYPAPDHAPEDAWKRAS
jgi:hypothetical protein